MQETAVLRSICFVLRIATSPRKLRVALGFPAGIAVSERIQQGIISYARQQGGWSFTQHPEMIGTSAEWLQSWHGDGAFVFAGSDQEIVQIRRLRVPVVNLLLPGPSSPLPTVSCDHYAIGRSAAEHFLSKKFRRLAFYGPTGLYFSTERLRGFEDGVAQMGLSKLLVPSYIDCQKRWRQQENILEKWLAKLEYPIGIFAASDRRANIVLEGCRRMGLNVPRQVAVLGADNDPLAFEMSEPALSTVARNDIEHGRRAAMLLESLILKRGTPPHLITIPPEGVIERESTRTLAVDDPIVAAAVERIQHQIQRPFGAEEIAAHTPISRRNFESRFSIAMGQSPYAFINQQRIERAKVLLEKTGHASLAEIAAACGFSSATRFRLVFKRCTGKLPSKWRPSKSRPRNVSR